MHQLRGLNHSKPFTTVLTAVVVLIIALYPARLPAQQYTIKFATLAPEGTTWMNIMKQYDQAIRQESGGRLGFKIYAGGVQGDEADVLRKMRNGQLHAAGITGNGITDIAPKARILDSPFLFRSYDEVDLVYKNFDTEFRQAFQDGGYILLGWAEVGFVYVFTNTPIHKPADMNGVKMWLWEGDPVAEASFRALGIHPIPLSISDVLTSLQTKMIDGVYTTPYAAIALQWFTRVKYMMDLPLADAAGAVVISKKKFDDLPKDLQDILSRNGKKYMAQLTAASRVDNEKSLATLKQKGITMVTIPSSDTPFYEETGRKARQIVTQGKLSQKGFTADFVKRVEGAIDDIRKSGAKSVAPKTSGKKKK